MEKYDPTERQMIEEDFIIMAEAGQGVLTIDQTESNSEFMSRENNYLDTPMSAHRGVPDCSVLQKVTLTLCYSNNTPYCDFKRTIKGGGFDCVFSRKIWIDLDKKGSKCIQRVCMNSACHHKRHLNLKRSRKNR